MDVKEFLKTLIKTESAQPEGHECRVADVIEAALPHDFIITRIDNGNGRCTLVASLPAETDEGGVCLVGHMDTVAFGDLCKWNHDPLSAYEEDGVIYGRGSADMKGGVAAMTAAALRILEEGKPLKKPLILCYTADEENRGIGVLSAVESGLLDKADCFIIAEPTDMGLGVCEKGALWLKFSAVGVQAHGSRPEIGLNAAEAVAELALGLKNLVDPGDTHPLLGVNTASLTCINAGVGNNVIPATASAVMDIRTLPGVDNGAIAALAEKLCAETNREDARWLCSVEVINQRAAVETEKGAALTLDMAELLSDMGYAPSERGLFFYTDASQIIPALDKPFVILGPGDDKQAHQINEHIPVKQLLDAEELYYRYLKKELL